MARKLKFQGGITKILCQKMAGWHKKNFRNNLQKIALPNSKQLNYDVISFSGSSGFEDQLLSIYSFLYYAGTPLKWIIYTDKSYTTEQKATILKIFPFVIITDWDTFNLYKEKSFIAEFLRVHSIAKKLNVLAGHLNSNQNIEHPTIYVDSDIVFYKNISYYLKSPIIKNKLWYVSDVMGNDVSDYFSVERSSFYPLNSGFLIFSKDFKTDDLFEYFEALHGKYDYFSEQSSFEFAFRKQNACLLDPRQFIIDTSDQFDFQMSHYPSDMAIRHYTGPVRHKMWQKGWDWHFKLHDG